MIDTVLMFIAGHLSWWIAFTVASFGYLITNSSMLKSTLSAGRRGKARGLEGEDLQKFMKEEAAKEVTNVPTVPIDEIALNFFVMSLIVTIIALVAKIFGY